jgi:hypothetical protein
MKKILILLPVLLLTGIIFYACQDANVVETSDASFRLYATVTPVPIENFNSGNAADECSQTISSCMYSYKIDNWDTGDMDGTYTDTETGFSVTISHNGKYFDWSSNYPVCAVIVKGGPGAHVFYYSESKADNALYAPYNETSEEYYDISHVTFCFNRELECQEETAWAAGDKYVDKGNWATYTQYQSTTNIILYAGQTIPVGTVSFSELSGGKITISIELSGGWTFQDVEEPVKVQGYDSAPPAVNPSPGLFTTYKGDELVFQVNPYGYYGIHLDVENCPE